MVVASLLMVPLAVGSGVPAPGEMTLAAALAVLALGLVSTALATVVYFKLITVAGPTFLSLINYLIPLWAVAVGMIFLGEQPQWSALAALALILTGIGLSESGRRKTGQSSSSVSQ